METRRVDFGCLQWLSSMKGARYKAFQRGNRQLRLVELSRGFEEQDWCLKGHIGYILDGEMELDFDGTLVRYSAGDGIFIPAGPENKHRGKVLTDVVTLVLVEDV